MLTLNLTIGIHQYEASYSKSENLSLMSSIIKRSDAYLDVFPEYFMGVSKEGFNPGYVKTLAEPLEGEYASTIIKLSKELKKAILFPMYLKENNKIFNVIALAEKGLVRGIYRKMHLFDAFGYRESAIFSRGDKPVIIGIKDFRIGLAVCFDLRFPELFRYMAYRGADLFIVPSAWFRGEYKLEQWYSLTVSRAHENTAFLIAVNQTGTLFTGHSLVASPLGYVKINLGEEKISYTLRIDKSELEKARKLIPVITLARSRHSITLN